MGTCEGKGILGAIKHTCSSTTIESMFTETAIGPLTKRRQLLLAVEALSTSNLERSHHSLAHFALLGPWSDFLNNTAEFMAQDVVFMKLWDSG